MYSGNDVGRHVSNTLFRLALEHAERVGGTGTIAGILEQAGENRPLGELFDDSAWSSYGQLRRLLEATGEVLGGVEPLTGVDESADMASGSMPSATEMLQLMGSPHALFEGLGNKGSAMTFTQLTTEQTEPSEWLIGMRYREGFEPYAALCALSVGIYRVLPRLFGYTKIDVVEETCVRRGDDVCCFRVGWDDGDEAERQQVMLHQRISLLESRLEQFQDTVADLVLAGDLETALERVVASVALSVRAPGFVLAIYPIPGLCRWVYAHGVDPDEAERVGALVLAGEPCPQVGEQVVDITSIRHRYGRLAVYDPQGNSLDDATTLAAYSRLAATALDSASALEDTRREVARGRALLDLSGALAEITTVEAMAASLARATTTVTGADRALVSVADREAGTVRIVASHGYPAEIAARLAAFESPINADIPDRIVYFDDAGLAAYGFTAPELAGVPKHVVVPISLDGEIVAWLTASVIDDPARLAPSDDLEARLGGLAAQASTAMRNAKLVEQIRHQALHDALTGLPNRALILDRTEQLLARAQRDHSPVSALFVDLDGFKEVNDTLGHAAGDQLLQAVANRLSVVVRHSDTLGRLGGDEFVVLVDGLDPGIGPDMVAERLLDVLREPFTLEDRHNLPLTVTASIGIATAAHHSTAGDLLRHADVALYEAKAAGKNRSVIFAPAMQTAVRDHLTLDADLRRALDDDQFFLVYQPIYDLRSAALTGVEALLRWKHPTRGVIEPVDFIPMLEETGLIIPVGRWVLEEACRQTARWHHQGHRIDISVNVSARQLDADILIDHVTSALTASGLAPSTLTLEITETTIMRDTEDTIRQLLALKTLGVRLAIDDFGTGYSSLAYLRQFPVDVLKIDRSFINAIAQSTEAGVILHTLVNLGKALGLETLAEGIEHDDQRRSLQSQDCDSGQGFLFAHPLTPQDLETFLGTPIGVTVTRSTT